MPGLVVTSGPQRGRVFRLEGETVVGRSAACGLQVLEPGVSGVHCRLELRGGWLVVRDLGSTNGTWLNGVRVDAAALRPGDRLRIGRVVFAVWEPAKHAALAGPYGRTPRPPVDCETPTLAGLASPFGRAALVHNRRAYFPPGLPARPAGAGERRVG